MSGVGQMYPWQTDPGGFLQSILGLQPKITSTFRTPAQNEAAGGVPNSEHLTGNAIDFTGPNMADLATRAAQSGVPFDQLINEGNHIHMGFRPGAERNQTFAMNGAPSPPQVTQSQMAGAQSGDPVDVMLAHRSTQPEGAPPSDPIDMMLMHQANQPNVLQKQSAPIAPQQGSFLSDMASNVGPSALNLGRNMLTPFMHPIDTGENLGKLALGLGEKLVPGKPLGYEQYPNAVGHYFANRYGSAENFAHTLRTDPVGTLADLAVPLTLGGGALARAPGVLGDIGEATAAAGSLIDPASNVVGAARAITPAVKMGKLLSNVVGTLGTHTGGLPLQMAAQAGYAGGDIADAFRANLTGSAPIDSVVTQARTALSNLRAQRGAAYRSGMLDISNDPTVLSFDPIDKALADVGDIKTFRGQSGTSAPQELAPSTTDVRQQITDAVNHWRDLNPNEFHTPEGFDALKQQVGDIKDAQPFNTPQRVVADKVYGAIRNTIAAQAPTYGKVMGDYENASNLLNDLQKTLSLNPNASVDTTVRKLQSALRDNVNTTYGRRADLAAVLQNSGAPTLMPSLAGQALHPWTPRGLGGVEGGAAILGSLATGHVAPLAALPFMSPRLMGETAYATGQGARALKNVKLPKLSPNATYQMGRLLQGDESTTAGVP